MKRRAFLTAAGAATASATVPVAAARAQAPAILSGRQEWRMVTSWPKGLPGVGTGAERLARRIAELTDGRITVRVYAAGELVPALQCFDAVANGTAELGHDASYYHLSKSEATAFFTCFPFGFTANELDAWVHHGGGQPLWDELYAGFGLKGFLAGNTGAQMVGWFRKEIRTAADLRGLKMRTPGNNARVLSKLGATIVNVPAGEIFTNLQSGALDAAEWVGPLNDLALGFYQVAPYYYSPGYQEPSAGLQLTVNKAKYDALPRDLQLALQIAAQAENNNMLAEYTALSGPALRTLVEAHGVQLRRLSPELLQALGDAANEVLNELHANGDPMTRRVIESFLEFRTKVRPWTRVGEFTYMQARNHDVRLALE
ncbi:TRAP transporter substrate-binding protein [Indioceanicola profundi]|uniref:TRAP transporter substrate-binding protein n=1 Tax=Indioceanicola profundi TaxID=2220096 RepID=UPI000E6ADB9A|nr:TRAP transporter substrate-binding protein [Indioceanicola profundi]